MSELCTPCSLHDEINTRQQFLNLLFKRALQIHGEREGRLRLQRIEQILNAAVCGVADVENFVAGCSTIRIIDSNTNAVKVKLNCDKLKKASSDASIVQSYVDEVYRDVKVGEVTHYENERGQVMTLHRLMQESYEMLNWKERWISEDDIDRIQKSLEDYVYKLVEVFGAGEIGQYQHEKVAGHYREFMLAFGSMGKFKQQSFEGIVKDVRGIQVRMSNHGGHEGGSVPLAKRSSDYVPTDSRKSLKTKSLSRAL